MYGSKNLAFGLSHYYHQLIVQSINRFFLPCFPYTKKIGTYVVQIPGRKPATTSKINREPCNISDIPVTETICI